MGRKTKQNKITTPELIAQISKENRELINDFLEYCRTIFYAHALRHYTVSRFKRLGLPDSMIQAFIGWANIAMVSVYSDLKADDELAQYFGADGIKKVEQKSFNDM